MEGNSDMEWIYDCVLQIIRSPEFRNPIKDFIDENCGTFIGVDENTFEQGALHKEFMELINNLLEILTKEIGITDEIFCMAAKKGLENEETKKYFEQLISFTNYNYFKNLMTKRNLQLEELAYKKMIQGGDSGNDKEELEKKAKEMEDKELECALKMSLAAEEEKKKLEALEDEELQKAIRLSLEEQAQSKEKTPLINAQPVNVPQPKSQKPPVQKEPEPVIEAPKETKLTPIDKVAYKQKLLQEHDAKMAKNIVSQKLAPINFTKGNNSELNKQLNDFEESKAKKLQEYREMIMRMKKERREKEEKEVEEKLASQQNNLNEEEKKRLDLRAQLAAKLKMGLKK